MGRMENKVAVITGAGGGLCEGIARSFAREGAKVVLVDKKPVVLEKAKEICEDGGEADVYKRQDKRNRMDFLMFT